MLEGMILGILFGIIFSSIMFANTEVKKDESDDE